MPEAIMMKVSRGNMCLDMNNRKMFAGTEFACVGRKPKGSKYGDREVPTDIVEDWMKNGFCEPLRHGEHSAPNPMSVDDTRSASNPVPVPAPTPDDKPTPQSHVIVTEQGVRSSDSPERPTAPRVEAPISPWMFDPQGLEGKSLEDLNAMIGERLDDNERRQFSGYASIPEAVAHLSQDFKSGSGARVTQAKG